MRIVINVVGWWAGNVCAEDVVDAVVVGPGLCYERGRGGIKRVFENWRRAKEATSQHLM